MSAMRPGARLRLLRLSAALTLSVAATGPSVAFACRLALALGLDASRSVSEAAYVTQKRGLIAAFQDPEVRGAILSPSAPVALAIYEWSGRWQQRVILGWTVLEDAAGLDAIITTLQAHDRSFAGQTAVGRALFFGGRLLLGAPDCAARTLDISGDGRNNDGPAPARIYARFNFGDITVNGLAIGGLEAGIPGYYRDHVIRGPGAFVEYAETWRDFTPVMRRKLLRELSAPLFSALPDQPPTPRR